MRAIINKNSKILLFLSAFLAGWLWSVGVASAADYGLKVSSTVTVAESGQASVKQLFSVTGADKTNLPASTSVNIVGSQPAGLSASGTDGTKLTTQYNSDSNFVTISIPASQRDSTKAWSFSLSYKSQLLSQYGATSAVQIPAMDTNLDITSQTTTLSADLDLGFATVRSRQPSKTGIGVGQQILTFTSKGAEDESLLVVFGEQTFVTAKFSTELNNPSWWWEEVGLTLPPDTNQQRVIIESIQPTPSKVRLDKDGNIVVFFNMGPLGSRQVEVTAHLSIDNPSYELSSARPVSETEALLSERYTQTTDAWQPLNLDIETTEDATSADIAKAVFDGVVAQAKEQMVNQESFDLSLRTSALKMSDWLAGELRNRGIPARLVLGVSMSNGRVLGENANSHAWVEANLAGVGWVTLDPYFGVYSGLYGSADPLRIAMGLWGLEDDRPPVDLGLASFQFNDEAPASMDSYGQLGVSAKKYMILPFISIFNQSVSLSAGGIVDGVTLANQREEFVLGSLAPYQQATQRTLLAGASSFARENVKASVASDEDSTVETESSTSYIILIIQGALLLVWLAWRWLKKRSRRQPKTPSTKIRRSKESLTLHDEALGGSIENENLVIQSDILPQPVRPAEDHPDNTPPPTSKLVQ
jgi:hypothetical protein